MKCGEGCPFCYGTGYEGDHCKVLIEMYGKDLHHYLDPYYHNGKLQLCRRSIWLSEVNGEAINENGDLVGNTCRFNFEKYVLWYYGLPCR